MDFTYSDEQELLRSTLERFIRENYDITDRRILTNSEKGYSDEHWRFFAEMGLLALPFADADGGLDGGCDDLMLVMEMIGRGLITEPYFINIVLAGGILARIENIDLRRSFLHELTSGVLQIAFAHSEPGNQFNFFEFQCQLAKKNDTWKLNGEKFLVLNGNSASYFIVSVKDDDNTVLCLLDSEQAGVTVNTYTLVDDSKAVSISFDNATVREEHILATGEQAESILRQVYLEARAAQCAEAYGCMQAVFEQTLEYVQVRKQFNRPIGSFQTIQHRLADMYTDCEEAKGMMMLANLTRESEQWPENVAAAKSFICNKSRKVSQEAIQLHGGMGVTEELAIGHYHKKIMLLSTLFGNEYQQLATYLEQKNQ